MGMSGSARWRRAATVLSAVLASLLLAGIFALYLQPDLQLALSQLMWSCLGGVS
jgi:hypothetical protein